MPQIKPRIHVLLARDAPVGVVIRRGPSKQVCTILWDRRTDELRPGQWFKGRIYECRSDLSPDGKLLIYFAMNGRWDSYSKGSWTAISRAPYLKAIAFFTKGDGWHGGGLFTGTDTYWLNDGYGHSVYRDTDEVRRDRTFQPSGYFGGECLGVYYPRLLRDGWRLIERVELSRWNHHDVLEKPAHQGWLLRKIAHSQVDAPQGKGCYWDEHELVHAGSGRRIPCPRWEWADLDGDRLVWAAEGRLIAGTLDQEGLKQETELQDFDGMAFEPIKEPD
jgi:hypothetical protein